MLCKIFTCFLLLTTGLMKKKEEKHVYLKKKGSHSIIHHFIGFQPDCPERNVISSPPTTHRRLVLNYGVRRCLAVCVRNCAQRDAQDSYLEWYLFLPCLVLVSTISLRLQSRTSLQTLQVQFYKQHTSQDGDFFLQPRNNDSQSGQFCPCFPPP